MQCTCVLQDYEFGSVDRVSRLAGRGTNIILLVNLY